VNRDPETDYSDLTDALKFFFRQMMKGLYVCIPGIIDSYNPTTKRATVHPAINLQDTEGTTTQQSSIANVPVVWPGGGGFSLLSPLPSGSPVSIFFSQRGITQFKEVFTEADPGSGLFAKEDAFIIPSFGALSVTPASTTGIVLQSEDGVDFVSIEDGLIEIKTDGNVEINGNADNAVSYTDLDTALQGLVSAINAALATKLDGAGSAGALTLDLSASKVDTVLLP